MTDVPNVLVLDMASRHGFREVETGGGCSALHTQAPDQSYVLITDAIDPGLPQGLTSPVEVGWYSKEGELKKVQGYPSLIDALGGITGMEPGRL